MLDWSTVQSWCMTFDTQAVISRSQYLRKPGREPLTFFPVGNSFLLDCYCINCLLRVFLSQKSLVKGSSVSPLIYSHFRISNILTICIHYISHSRKLWCKVYIVTCHPSQQNEVRSIFRTQFHYIQATFLGHVSRSLKIHLL